LIKILFKVDYLRLRKLKKNMNLRKKLSLVAFVFSLFGSVNAQNIAFEQEKVHALYSNFENPLKIASAQKFDSLTVEYDYYFPVYADKRDKDGNYILLDNTLMKGIGSVTKGASENSYIVEVRHGVNAKLNIHLDGKIIESRDYKILVVPEPILKLGNAGSSDAAITLEELRKIKSLTCEKIDWEYEEQYEIQSFYMTILGSGKVLELWSGGVGAQFGQEMLDALSKVQIGDKVIIENIRVYLGEDMRVSNNIFVKITD